MLKLLQCIKAYAILAILIRKGDLMIYIYTRISSYGQVKKGQKNEGEEEKIDSIENQIKRCKGWLIANNYDDSDKNITVVEEKAVSGSLPLNERQEGGPMFKSLNEGDVLICHKLDRLFRNLHDSVNVSKDLRDRKVTLVLMDIGGNVTDDMMGQMYFTMISLFAEFERKKIAARTKEGSDNRKEEGGFIGGPPPFGWKSVIDPKNPKRKILIKNEDEQKILTLLVSLRKKDKLSYERISYHLRKHGYDKHPSTWMRIYDKQTTEMNNE